MQVIARMHGIRLDATGHPLACQPAPDGHGHRQEYDNQNARGCRGVWSQRGAKSIAVRANTGTNADRTGSRRSTMMIRSSFTTWGIRHSSSRRGRVIALERYGYGWVPLRRAGSQPEGQRWSRGTCPRRRTRTRL
jgi:hypothetical protein